VVPLFFSTFFFSFIGIPPFSGFFAKFYIIVTLFHSGYLFAAVIMGFFSVVSAFYYLKIIKSMFFESKDFSSIEKSYWVIPTSVGLVVILFGLFNLFFVFFSPYFLGLIFSFCGVM
jgi:NADH-quinone oxidoreductase subunit N